MPIHTDDMGLGHPDLVGDTGRPFQVDGGIQAAGTRAWRALAIAMVLLLAGLTELLIGAADSE